MIVVDDEDDFLADPAASGRRGEEVGGGLIGDPVGLYFARLFKSIKGPGEDALVTVSAIAGADPTVVPDGGLPSPADCTAADAGITSSCKFLDNSAHSAGRLFGVVEQTGGLGQSICEQGFDGILQNLGQLLVGLARQFTIATSGQQLLFQASSLSVTVTAPGKARLRTRAAGPHEWLDVRCILAEHRVQRQLRSPGGVDDHRHLFTAAEHLPAFLSTRARQPLPCR